MQDLGISRHDVSVRAGPRYYLGQCYRHTLNIPLLQSLVETYTAPPPQENVGKGKKRAAPVSSRDAKRRKTTKAGAPTGAASNYPKIHPAPPTLATDPTPIFHQTLSLRYTTATVGQGADGQQRGWPDEEACLVRALDALDDSENTVDLGAVSLVDAEGEFVGAADDSTGEKAWLFSVPSSATRLPPLSCVSTLMVNGRVSVKSSLKLVRNARGPSDESVFLPFRLDVDILVSLTPSFANSVDIPLAGNKGVARLWHDSILADAQEQLVRTLYFPSAEPHAVNIPFFYSILAPAPALSSADIAEVIQPTELLPTLLPFQRRSLGWLLGREGKTISSTGQVISKEDDSEYTFWQRVDVGNSSFYFNRFTGEVAKDYSPASPAYGGILAEEPGLGKTLEIISLILSNPAPPERNPTDQIVWDPVAEIDVKAIKVGRILLAIICSNCL